MSMIKRSLLAAALCLSALGLGASAAHAQWVPLDDARLENERPPSHGRARSRPYVSPGRREALGFGVAGIVTGAVGVAIGGPVLLIAGTTRTHCTGSWISGSRTCVDAPNDVGDIVGGVLSIVLGAAGLVTGIVLVASRPSAPRATLSFRGDSTSWSLSLDGTF
jgi:hypothetical protein